ncbi:MAG: glycosyltransferase [Tannerella sp.]|jgi:glycosyltransferase involved in cell wall biosynthesis|nr:glycosyltransferase [Tannerella sp.]
MESLSPVFSIVTVTRNAEKVLERTILSVLNQSCPQIEYIIVDGNSSDNTKDLIAQYASGLSSWMSEPDTGLYDAMNKGLHMATGDYVWFLNAGDVLPHNNTVTDLAAIAVQNGMPDILYGETDLMDSKGNVFAKRRLKVPGRLTWKSFRMGMLVCHQAFIVKRDLAPEYDLQYRFSSDFDWCIRCLKDAKSAVHSGLRLVNYQYEGATTANRKASLKERYKIMCNYYGAFPVQIRHIWFAIRFYWAKIFKNNS